MKSYRYPAQFIALLVVLILALSLTISQVAGQEANPGAPGAPSTLYLPLVQKAPGTIYGHVTDGGVAAPNVQLELHRLNTNTLVDTTVETKSTDPDGFFAFLSKSALGANEVYFVKYPNIEDDTTRLFRWYTRALTTYMPDSLVHIGDFDIADVPLSLPVDGANVDLPETFRWIPRPASPQDSYEFDLFEDCDHCPLFYTDPPLGYVDNYRLMNLPPGFTYNTQYLWEIWVYNPDGSYGISYDIRAVTFSSTGMSAAPAEALTGARREQRLEERLQRNLQIGP